MNEALAAAEEDERSLVWLRLAVGLALVLPIAFFCVVGWVGYKDALQSASARLDDVARIAEEHAARVFETNDVVVEQLSAMLKDDDDLAIWEREHALHQILGALLLRLPQLQSLSIWNADGRPLATNSFFPVSMSLDVSGERFFERARGQASGRHAPHIVEARPGQSLFYVVRRRELSDGRFGGLYQLSLRAAYFDEYYERMAKSSPGVAFALETQDGGVIARAPRAAAEAVDSGEDALRVTRRVGAYPIAVSAAQSRAAVLADWRQHMTVLGAITFPTALALAFASVLALRRTRRAMDAARRLRQESEQRLRVEEALRHAQKLEALGQLTGGVAHDFNNLMSVVSNNAHLLARRLPQLGASSELAAIRKAVDGGTRLTRQLLAFSRRQALRPEVVALQEAIPAMLDLLGTTTGKAITLSVEVSPDTPAVEVDAVELENALINLAANARDAMSRAGSLRIVARAAQPGEGPADEDHPYAVISVTDSGEGISKEDLERVFEPFFTTKPVGSGTGLGLSQVYGFCAQAGGRAEISSEPGSGTTVSLYLPATERPSANATPRAPKQRIALRGHVLLVEDNADVAGSLTAVLRDFGCSVTPVASAESAEQLLNAGLRFDCVLSDIVMPGDKDGLALAFSLRDRHPQVPLLLMTGYAKEVARAVSAGIEVLSKPCAPEELARALARALAPRARGASTAANGSIASPANGTITGAPRPPTLH